MAGRSRWAQLLGMRLSLLTETAQKHWPGPSRPNGAIKDRTEAALTGRATFELANRLGSGGRSEA